MTNEAQISIKTLDVTGPRKDLTNATVTVGRVVPDLVAGHRIIVSCENKYQVGLRMADELEEIEVDYVTATDVLVGNIKELFQERVQQFKLPNAVGDVEQIFVDQQALSFHCPVCLSGGGFMTSPLSATLNVIDKKFSEVFQEVFALRQPEEEDDPIPTDLAYWNALKTVAGAYSVLRSEYRGSVDLVPPTAIVDSSGGVRLIWRTETKLVKANFGGRRELKSYLYYESGQIYDVETLDSPTLARRLGWLV